MDQPTSTGPKSGLNKELEGTWRWQLCVRYRYVVSFKQTDDSEVRTAPVITVMNRPED
jgi:hypothetical protein